MPILRPPPSTSEPQRGFGGRLIERCGPDVGPGKRLVWSRAATSEPGARHDCKCANCGGPNAISASACEWCRVDFAGGRGAPAQKAPLKVFQG